MLTVLRVIDQNLASPNAKSNPGTLAAAIRRNDFKIIYVCAIYKSHKSCHVVDDINA